MLFYVHILREVTRILSASKISFNNAFMYVGILIARRIWRDYCLCADGVVFIIDGCDRLRFEEAREELDVRTCMFNAYTVHRYVINENL